MYLESDLIKYEYFSELLKRNTMEHIIDSLTGLVNRKYMLDFAKYLIDKNIDFTLSIIDLDDFKLVNDKYGHTVGDYILENVASDLIKYVGCDGVVGRYGGDEFIMVVFGKNEYDVMHEFFDNMFHSGEVFRKTHVVSKEIKIYVTGTVGSAVFPTNAKTFDELFLMADKTLYRGKTKGRNCYVIYVHEKHKDLVIQKMHNDDLPIMMSTISATLNSNLDFHQKLIETASYLKDNLNLDNVFVIDDNNNFYNMVNMEVLSKNGDLSSLVFKNERYQIDYRNDVSKLSFGKDIKHLGLASLLITRLKLHDNVFGYLIFALKRNGKVWDTNEISILMYFSKVITLEMLSMKII